MSGQAGRDIAAASRFSRRAVVVGSVGAGAVGASWLTSLAFLARGRKPHVLIVGAANWQLILIEDLMRRALFFSGEFEEFPAAIVRRLLSVLRPRVDLVAGTEATLGQIPESFFRRHAVSGRLILDRDQPQGNPIEVAAVGAGVDVRVGAMMMRVSPIVDGEWRADTRPRSWMATLRVERLAIGIAPSLDTLARHADPSIVAALAPGGHLEYLHRLLPNATVVTNAATVNASHYSAVDRTGAGRPLHLVRTFARDVSVLVITGGGLVLPDWTETVYYVGPI